MKVIWITGASSGIGEALAYAFSAAGDKVLISARRTEELERVKAGCANPGMVRVLPMDLLDTASFGERVREAIGAFGQVDILVHNGGVTQRGYVVDTELAVQRQVMELDYFSYVALTKAMLPHFIERKSGHFVVMSSVMGKIGTPMRSAYAAAKHALHGFFDCLRAEVAAMGILVTVLTPGYVQTNISQHAITGDGSALGKASENIEKGLPASRAADKIMRAVRKGRYEAYIGKRSMEWVALVLNRLAPGLVMKLAPKFVPK
ncbi:MAG TPA: SDR family oxidoreductase [Puia sp.]|uniref:SDR family oxidoreductase n=1 Tax=Puia sp. TaxID=2045100 RepID=UPI002BEA0510|nr:SDR family oxidoreductase [Puia sp.]HVU95157.1 SDR family oxidoreductase [Puia sp.]